MSHQSLRLVTVAAAVWIAAMLVSPVSAQTRRSPTPVVKKWTPPRTPWGDPDLQGSFSNTSENGTPLERPEIFEGRKLEDIKGEELVAIKREAQKRTVENFQGPLHAPDGWWQPDLNMTKGSQAWLIVDPPNGKIPPLTPDASQRAAARAAARRNSGRGPADSWEDRSLYDRCITRGLPGSMMPAIYGNSYQILQAPGYVTMVYEMIHEIRVIPLDGRPHAAPNVRSYMGDARGHWEGDTLVVETTNFRDGIWLDVNGSPLTDAGKVIERFRRVNFGKMEIDVTVEDPKAYTRPWTVRVNHTLSVDQELYEFICHENQRFAPALGGNN
jgi:hypothetical protein